MLKKFKLNKLQYQANNFRSTFTVGYTSVVICIWYGTWHLELVTLYKSFSVISLKHDCGRAKLNQNLALCCKKFKEVY